MTHNNANLPKQTKTTVFTFGEPETVINARYSDYTGVYLSKTGEFYTPPYSKKGLAKLLQANAHHGTIPKFKTNLAMRTFKPSLALSSKDLRSAFYDFCVFGECYFYLIKNALGNTLILKHMMAINMRVKVNENFRLLMPDGKYQDYAKEDILHIKEVDVEQNIYGVPDYVGAIQAILLNEGATIFRRRYYANGAHVGYILYTTNPDLTEEDEKAIEQQLTQSKGVGNFRSMFINIPDGKEKGVQIIPVGDFSAKDDLAIIKNLTRNDIIAAWRMNPALAGIIPENVGGFGDIEKIDKIYTQNEINPMLLIFEDEINSLLFNDRKIEFKGLLDRMENPLN